jgi:superfamily II DNA or RNA helicase
MAISGAILKRSLMIQLTVDNSYSRITGLSDLEHKELKELLSYEIDAQAAYFSGSFRTKRSLFGKRGDFPTGCLYLVNRWLNDKNHVYNDHRTRPQPRHGLFSLNLGLTPYQPQLNAVKACLTHNRGTISAVTGSGKSVMMALLVNALQLRTLIIVPNLALKNQLTESFRQYFGSLTNITIENIDSSKLINERDYDVLIIDEAHHVAAKTYRNLNKKAWGGIYHRYFFTATPYRSREEEQLLMESVCGEVIYKLDYKTAVDSEFIAPVEAYYIELPHTDTDGYTWSEVYSDLVVNNEARNKIIKNLIHLLEGQNVLTLVKEIRHGEWLKTITGSPFANGQDEGSKDLISQFSNGEFKSLIGTTGVMGEGIDSKPTEWVIIAGLGKSRPAFIQQVGRGIRKYEGKESCKVIIFKDKSHKWTLAHFNAQVRYLKEEYGIKPAKLEVE